MTRTAEARLEASLEQQRKFHDFLFVRIEWLRHHAAELTAGNAAHHRGWFLSEADNLNKALRDQRVSLADLREDR